MQQLATSLEKEEHRQKKGSHRMIVVNVRVQVSWQKFMMKKTMCEKNDDTRSNRLKTFACFVLFLGKVSVFFIMERILPLNE